MTKKQLCMQTISLTLIVAVSSATTTYASVDVTRRDLPQDFSKFLHSCSEIELARLAMSLRLLPKLDQEDFGKYGLGAFDSFSDNMKQATKEKPLRPSTYNDVSPDIVVSAISNDRIDKKLIDPSTIKRQLVWISSNKITYMARDKENINYHSLVQWVAKSKGISRENIKALPTFELEKKIFEVYWAEIWESLTPEQRMVLLNNIERETGLTIANKAGIVTMTGTAAIAALVSGTYVALGGFVFFQMVMVTISTAAGLVGLTLPFVVYTTAAQITAILTGPVGWFLVATSMVIGGFLASMPSKDKTASFIMTVSLIKAERLYGESL